MIGEDDKKDLEVQFTTTNNNFPSRRGIKLMNHSH